MTQLARRDLRVLKSYLQKDVGQKSYPVEMVVSGDRMVALPKSWLTEVLEFMDTPEPKKGQTWGTVRFERPLVTAHMARSGSPDVQCYPDESRMTPSDVQDYLTFHKMYMDRGLGLSCGPEGGQWELIVVPVFENTGNGKVSAWWGYPLKVGLAAHVSRLISDKLLAVVFDLDDTLILGRSLEDTKYQIQQLKKIEACLKDGTPGICLPELEGLSLHEQLAVIQQIIIIAEVDRDLMEQYKVNKYEYVEFNGSKFHSKVVTVVPEGGKPSYQQRVITIDNLVPKVMITFTIEGEHGMILARERPGWTDLKEFLAQHPNKFKVYFCTAAERRWALEACRLLDVFNVLIPLSERETRIITTGQKRLACVLENKAAYADNQELVMIPWAVAFDDRLDVWDGISRSCTYQVGPWSCIAESAIRAVRKSITLSDEKVSEHFTKVTGSFELDRVHLAINNLWDGVQTSEKKVSALLAVAHTTGIRHSKDGPSDLAGSHLKPITIQDQLQNSEFQSYFQQRTRALSSYLPTLDKIHRHSIIN